MQEYAKHIARQMLTTFCVVSARKKTSVHIPKMCREIGQSFEESLQGGELVKNLEIF